MDNVIAVVGFGEAGQAFAAGWNMGSSLRAYDVALRDANRAQAMRTAFRQSKARGCEEPAEAVRGAAAVFCLVPTDQTITAAEINGPLLDQDTLWLDGSSSAPSTKRAAADIIQRGRGHYVDMAIMAPVFPKLHRTPVLLSGPESDAAHHIASALGMTSQVIGTEVGDSSAVKMLRSIIVKGMEALTAECLLAARRAGVEELVFASLTHSATDADWPAKAIYNLDRMTVHGARRAAEMREVAKTLEDLQMPHWMASSTALWQDRLAGVHIGTNSEQANAHLDDVLAALT